MWDSGTLRAIIGCQALRIRIRIDIKYKRAAPYRIDWNGTLIRRAPASSLRIKRGVRIYYLIMIIFAS